MKKFLSVVTLVALAVLVVPVDTNAVTTGNGAPSGAHYNLNIIGVPKGKTADMTGNSGHRIFVPLEGQTKIWLCEAGEDVNCPNEGFQVLDANGTDANGATFALPAADTDPDTCVVVGTNADGSDILLCGSGVTTYSVFVRALGGKGGSAKMQLCGIVDGEEVCGTNILELDSDSRPSKFKNATAYLLYLYDVDVDGDGDVDYKRIPLFSDELDTYFWSYDNNGLKLAQLRFYPCSTTVTDEWVAGSDNIVSTQCGN